MRVRGFVGGALIGLAAAAGVAGRAGAAAGDRAVPYWASLSAGQARARTGPGRQFPINWLYQRAGLPVKVTAVVPSWRRIEDPDGDSGWVMANLLSDQRTAMVKDGVQPLRATPEPEAAIVWRAQAGVVGRVSHCGEGWCRLDVKGRQGFIETDHLWGVDPNEDLP